MIKIKEKILNTSREDLKRMYSKIKDMTPGEYNVYVTNGRSQRSLEQNAYYHGVVVKIISDHTGYIPYEVHQKLKFLFNPELLEVKGEMFKVPGSTKSMNTKQFAEYLEQIRIWAWQELELEIPEAEKIPEEEAIKILEETE